MPDGDTFFEIGSITKTYTATLVAELSRQGVVELDSSIIAHLNQSRLDDSSKLRSITLRSLLTQTSGLPREAPNMDINDDDRFATYTVLDLYDGLNAISALQTAGDYRYSNFGFVLLEHVIEAAAGRSYEELLVDLVLEPSHLSDSVFAITPELSANVAIGFRDGEETSPLDTGQWQAMGGLRASARDLLTYVGMQVGLIDSDLSLAMQQTQVQAFADEDKALGLGWNIDKSVNGGQSIFFHKGGTNGFVSFAGFNHDRSVAVVVLVNGRRWYSDLGLHLLDPDYPLADPD